MGAMYAWVVEIGGEHRSTSHLIVFTREQQPRLTCFSLAQLQNQAGAAPALYERMNLRERGHDLQS